VKESNRGKAPKIGLFQLKKPCKDCSWCHHQSKKHLIHAKSVWNWLEFEIKSVPIH